MADEQNKNKEKAQSQKLTLEEYDALQKKKKKRAFLKYFPVPVLIILFFPIVYFIFLISYYILGYSK